MKIHRRDLLLGVSSAWVLSYSSTSTAMRQSNSRSAFDPIADDVLRHSPETATLLGLDRGQFASERSRLDDRSLQGRHQAKASVAKHQKILREMDLLSLEAQDAIRFHALNYALETAALGRQFSFGTFKSLGGGNPYVLSQRDGAYQSVPEFLLTKHRIEAGADAEAYLSRMRAFARALDDDNDACRSDAASGIIPPQFLLDTTLGQIKSLAALPPGEQPLVRSLKSRTQAAGMLSQNWGRRAEEIFEKLISPALARQEALIHEFRSHATDEAGVWRLPNGDGYYEWALRCATSTSLSPDEIHRMGLEQGAVLDGRMDQLLKLEGLTQGSVADRMAALARRPDQVFPNTEEGKAATLAYVREQIAALRGLLPKISRMTLKAPLEIKRVPENIEDGAALGYADPAALDGSRPASYYINLKDTANWPKFSIPSLSAHEGIPGHCWQFAYLSEREDRASRIDSLMYFNAFVEGWGLYAEQLVDECGFYQNNPLGKLGMLQKLRFRATRLVVDTGLHWKKWSRAEAITYLTDASGRSSGAIVNEIDRYCAHPGQACGYKVGHSEILRIQDKARATLGEAFDIREFNDLIVQTGGVPVAHLSDVVERYTARGARL